MEDEAEDDGRSARLPPAKSERQGRLDRERAEQRRVSSECNVGQEQPPVGRAVVELRSAARNRVEKVAVQLREEGEQIDDDDDRSRDRYVLVEHAAASVSPGCGEE